MLTLDQLRTLQVIARTGSFSRAGRELFLTQPAISQRVREIERLFGAELFERTRGRNGGLQLTPAGVRVIEFAQEMLDAYERLCREVVAPEEESRDLVIGVPGPDSASRLMNLLLPMTNDASGFRLELAFLPLAHIADAVRDGRVDAGIVSQRTPGDDLLQVPLWADRWLLAFAPGMAGDITNGYTEPGAPRTQCGPLRVGLPTSDTSIRPLIDRVLGDAGIVVEPLLESRFVEPLRAAVLAGVGACFLPEHVVARELREGSVAAIPMPGMPLECPLALAFQRKPASRAARDLWSALSGRQSPSRGQG